MDVGNLCRWLILEIGPIKGQAKKDGGDRRARSPPRETERKSKMGNRKMTIQVFLRYSRNQTDTS